MDPLYKVGDTVLIKSVYDSNHTGFDYRFTFTEQMLHEFGGKIVEIAEVHEPIIEYQDIIQDDGCLYHLKEDDMRFCWHLVCLNLNFRYAVNF